MAADYTAAKSVPIATLITDVCAKLLSNHASLPSCRRSKLPLGNLRPDGSVTLLHDEEAAINDLMSSLGTDR
jgi:hypothetical protein